MTTYAIVVSGLYTLLCEYRDFLRRFPQLCKYGNQYRINTWVMDGTTAFGSDLFTWRYPRHNADLIRVIDLRCECALGLADNFLLLCQNATFRIANL